jgi:hypothetical protein
MKTKTVLQTAIAATLLLSTSLTRADQTVSANFNLPVSVKCTVDETGCQNHPGPTITVGGQIALGSVTARITFSNNAKGTHTATVDTQYDVTLLLGGSTITIPKQPVLGGVGGNPYIYFQFTDSKSNAVSQEIFLGRCVQGLTVTSELVEQAALLSHIIADCSNHPGPFITLDGTIKLAGLNGKLIFRNNPKGTHTAEYSTTVSIIAEGTDIVLPKQPPQGGAGGNPIISIQFFQGGTPIGDSVVLGRCNQI